MAFTIHAVPALHPIFESLAYLLGFAIYRGLRGNTPNPTTDMLNDQQRWSVLTAAAVGALLGSRILGLLEQAPRLHGLGWRVLLLPGGKTIVGGLLGGWIAVEIAKRIIGIHSRTGDLFALPLCIGIAIGRVGCFFSGLADDTCGKPTSLPWAVDFGDGIPRHPTQVYEIVFLLVLAGVLAYIQPRPHRAGVVFRIFLASYLAFRFTVDLLKPQPLVYGLNAIQWACITGLSALAVPFLLASDQRVRCQAN